ncbi:MAG: RNA methyltransferase [Burkholderiaceae bacterium]|nr:RNA methyltransferase [Burkholderiaceae bacterium]
MTAPVVKAVASRDNPLLVRLRKLGRDPVAYRKLGELWIEGDHLCRAFLQRGGVPLQAVISEAGWASPLRELAQEAPAVAVLPAALMGGVSTLESPAPIGFVVPWIGAIQLHPDAATVVLDRLQDAGNVGTILRSASAFGFTQVVALKGTAGLWSPKVLRAGMGAHFGLSLVEGVEAAALGSLSIPMLATSSYATQAIHEVALPWPCAWVLGHEGEGVSAALQVRCSLTLRIPQPGGEESLNVGAAAAVCLYESARQRLSR